MTVESTNCKTMVTVADAEGLHMRPIAMLVQVARQFEADVLAEGAGRNADAKSLLSLIKLCAEVGSRICVRAAGIDARKAIQAIRATFPSVPGRPPPAREAPAATPAKPIRKPHTFVWRQAPAAQAVSVAGSFNHWTPVAMTPSDGRFQASVDLPRGDHEYKFIVDGVWREDPAAPASAPNAFGTRNSVLRVE